MRRFKKFFTPSRTSPKGGRRACLCKDNTYSIKCCDGSLRAQGIGSTVGEDLSGVWYGYTVQRCSATDIHKKPRSYARHRTNSRENILFNIRKQWSQCLLYGNSRTSRRAGIHINTASIAYDDCTDCENAN